MRKASVAEIKARLSSYLKASASDPIVVTRNGKAVAVLLAVNNEEELERLLSARAPKLNDLLDAAERRIDAGAGISHDEFWNRVESTKRSQEQGKIGKKRRTKRGA